ncbi:hypothetical protein [Microbacterium aurum]
MSLTIDWDRERWLYLPDAFPWHVYPDEDAWITTITGAFVRAGWTAEQASWLGDYLRGLRANNTSGAHRFAWLLDPQAVLASIDVFDLEADPDQTLADLTGSDGSSDDLRPPLVTEVTAADLGSGHRVERSLRVPRPAHESIDDDDPVGDDVMLMVFWVFRSPRADVVVTATHGEPLALAAVLPDIEALIDRIRVAD